MKARYKKTVLNEKTTEETHVFEFQNGDKITTVRSNFYGIDIYVDAKEKKDFFAGRSADVFSIVLFKTETIEEFCEVMNDNNKITDMIASVAWQNRRR